MSLVRTALSRSRSAFVSIAVTALLVVAFAVGTAGTASAACAAKEKLVPSQSFVMVASRDNRTIYQFRTTQVNRSPAVFTLRNGRYLNTYSVPAGFNANTVVVYLKNQRVPEIFNGRVRYVFKQRTYVQACTSNWRIV